MKRKGKERKEWFDTEKRSIRMGLGPFIGKTDSLTEAFDKNLIELPIWLRPILGKLDG